MRTTAKRDGDAYILNGNKTYITNGPYATPSSSTPSSTTAATPTSPPPGADLRARPRLEGFEQSAPFRKMGQHSSPTGELFLTDVVVAGPPARRDREESVAAEGQRQGQLRLRARRDRRHGLGVIEECLALSIAYAKDRVLWGKPIGSSSSSS